MPKDLSKVSLFGVSGQFQDDFLPGNKTGKCWNGCTPKGLRPERSRTQHNHQNQQVSFRKEINASPTLDQLNSNPQGWGRGWKRESSHIFFYLFIFGCTGIYLFLALCRLFLVAVIRGYCSLWGMGFSLQQNMPSRALRVQQLWCRAQSFHGSQNLPRPGIEPVSPALVGGLLPTVPPGKSYSAIFLKLLKCF